jgi:multimeric flavodoxin WrbA
VKVTAILGSPRKNGNTDTLAGRLLQGAEEAGHVTETAALRRLTIRPCIGCEQCWKKGPPCVLDDDMLPLYETVASSDVLVFATPVYWYAPTAIMKGFLDRLVPFNRPQGRPLIEGRGAILVTAYEEEGPQAAEPLVRMFELSFRYLGLRFLDRIVIDRLGPKGAVFDRPEALEAAYRVGRGLG